MKNTVRIVNAVHHTAVGNPSKSVVYAIKSIKNAASINADIIVLPALSLTGATIGDLIKNKAVLSGCDAALNEIIDCSSNINAYIIVGLPVSVSARIFQTAAVIHSGKLLGYLPACEPLEGYEGKSLVVASNNFLPKETLFDCGALNFAVISCDPARLPIYASEYLKAGVDLIINSAASPSIAGYSDNCKTILKALSKSTGCAISVCNANLGESSSPNVYRPFSGIFECGEQLAWQNNDSHPFMTYSDIDIDIIGSQKFLFRFDDRSYWDTVGEHSLNTKNDLMRNVRKNPFLPSDLKAAVDIIPELFELQTNSLVSRIQNTGIKKVILGCSGGIDSTLALLVCVSAMDSMSLPRKNVIGITMPGFGTSVQTYQNSINLINKLKITSKEISITDSVIQHFKDIGHDENVRDIVYENSQARERTQILLDIANKENALVIGTGDLSEEALGWCTYGGDHLASFNLNASITKTLARLIIEYISESEKFDNISYILKNVLSLPVSPELLPADKNGEIEQKTEKILGAYQLHEFFLYYFVKYGFPPSKIYRYALSAFEAEYSKEYILETLIIFIRKFFQNQFKRSCAPDGASITDVSLSPSKFIMPSDASSNYMLKELESSL